MFCASAHRFPHVYLARRVSTKVLLVTWRDFGSETLRPELFAQMTDVGRTHVSELSSLDFVALLRHRHRTRPPARKVRMGKNMSARESTTTKR